MYPRDNYSVYVSRPRESAKYFRYNNAQMSDQKFNTECLSYGQTFERTDGDQTRCRADLPTCVIFYLDGGLKFDEITYH